MKEPRVMLQPGFSKESREISLVDFLTTDFFKEKITALRSTDDENEQNKIKRGLPAIAIYGTFKPILNDRDQWVISDKEITSYNGLVFVDLDQKDNPEMNIEETKRFFSEFDEAYYCGLSSRGKGLHVLIKVPDCHGDYEEINAHHQRCFAWTQHLFEKEFGLIMDGKCKNLSRLRFASYDPNYYLNPNPSDLEVHDAPRKEINYEAVTKTAPVGSNPREYLRKVADDPDPNNRFRPGNRNWATCRMVMKARTVLNLSIDDAREYMYEYAECDFPAQEIEGILRWGYSKPLSELNALESMSSEEVQLKKFVDINPSAAKIVTSLDLDMDRIKVSRI